MDHLEYLKRKELFTSRVKDTLREMGLKVLEKSIDYFSFKPDMVAVYPNKMKYYIAEPVSEGCLAGNSPRLYAHDSFEEYRDYCRRLFSKNETHAAIAAAVICDLAYGVESFDFKSIGTIEFNSMDKYACLALPCSYVRDAAYVLDHLKIAFQELNVLERFSLVLISKKQSPLLGETRKFIKFILDNS